MKYHALAFAMATLVCSPAAALTLVDTGTPTDGSSYNTPAAGLFTLAAAATVTSVEAFVGTGFNATGTISIYTGGVDPQFSGLLHSANFAIIGSGAGATTGAWRGVFGQSWNLAAGQYWAVFDSDDAQSRMFIGAPNPLSQYAILGQGAWLQLGSRAGLGFRITNDAAPIIITPPVSGAVPEPATWAMLILGFGAVGGAMRSRRRVAVSYA